MANVLVSIEKGVEIAAEDALHYVIGFAQKEAKVAPAVVAALAVLLGGTEKALADVATQANTPATTLNIPMDAATLADIKAVWPEIKSFADALGIKL